jgi:uncharacterized RDD family membrane protein YckC
MNYASRTTRLIGQFLDGIVGGAPLLLALFVAPFSHSLGTLLLIGAVGWSVFYYFLADGLHDGQSLGKQWLGMRVVGADSGAPCSFGQSFIRNLLLAALGPIDWIFIFGERHQRLGDKAAGTVVISV